MTVHPRTKVQTYDGRADWSLVARARELLDIPVVGVETAMTMHSCPHSHRSESGQKALTGEVFRIWLNSHCVGTHHGQVGNGDVVSVAAARQLVSETGCGAVMIGRGVVSDPLLFHRIRSSYGSGSEEPLPWEWEEPEVVETFLRRYRFLYYLPSITCQ